MYPPIHPKPPRISTFERLDMLWERYPQYHDRTTFSTLEALLEEHESYRKDFDELREEYEANDYERFLVQLSWADLSYRYETRKLIEEQSALPEPDAGPAAAFAPNPYVEAFMEQFGGIDTDKKACFLFPESFVSQFFVIMEVCKNAEFVRPVRNLFPDEERAHYLAVFDKQNMDDV